MFSTHEIRAILFDLDGTLRHNEPSANHVLIDQAERLGLPVSLEKRRHVLRWAHYYWAQSPELLDDLQIFPSLTPDFWVHYLRRALLQMDCSLEQAATLARQINRFMEESYRPQTWIPEDIPTTLSQLQKNGFTLAVVSNRSDSYDEQLLELGLNEYFVFSLAAGEINAWKPNPEIFEHALKRLNVAPEQAVYVGDNYYADIIGAQRAGMAPVLIDPEELFPDADCPTIDAIGELLDLLI